MTRLTMDLLVTYRIRFPGELPKDWLLWETRLEIEVDLNQGKSLSTTITGKLDQAALMGLLRWLYNLGIPLISVECVDFTGGEYK